MNQTSTSRNGNEIPEKVLEILHDDPGSFVRVARRLAKSRSHISKVAAGHRRSERVRLALIREAIRLAKLQGYKIAIELEDQTRR